MPLAIFATAPEPMATACSALAVVLFGLSLPDCCPLEPSAIALFAEAVAS